MGRHELREQVFRLLFREEFHSAEDMALQRQQFEENLPAEEDRPAISEADAVYITERCARIEKELVRIDRIINDNTEGWDTGRMGKVELTVLRLAVYEIVCDEDIPDAVAINEAVEIAKQYGQESSGAFVNAVLGKVSRANERNT
ncbi:MAG: transcription antitermination factor NusB [Lachnospiraceae bacterium]|nr:transcription antitermination factor NusB [Lachnospiraceae bacterium]